MANSSPFRFWGKFLSTSLRYPKAFIAQVNVRNVKTLWRAIRYEPPSLILYNLKALLQGKDRLQMKEGQSPLFQEGTLTLYLEFFEQTDHFLEVKGWAAGEGGLKNLSLYADEERVKEGIWLGERRDTQGIFGIRSQQALGFHLIYRGPMSFSDLCLVLTDEEEGVLKAELLNWQRTEDEKYADWIKQQSLFSNSRRRNSKSKIYLVELNPAFKPIFIRKFGNKKMQEGAPTLEFQPECVEANAYYLLLDNDSELAELAESELEAAIAIQAQTFEILYWDDDHLEPLSGKRRGFRAKPAWSPEYWLAYDYIGPNLLVKGTVLRAVGDLDQPGLSTRLILHALKNDNRVGHLPLVLSHRKLPGHPERSALELDLIRSYLQHHFPGQQVKPGLAPGSIRVQRVVSKGKWVSIIIPFRDRIDLLRTCLDSIYEKTIYPHIEILLVNNQSQETETLRYLEKLPTDRENIRILPYDAPFNYSAINNWAVDQAKGEYIVLLNNDIEVKETGWLEAMLEYGQQKQVGAVGARLLYPDNTVQHAGVIVGLGGAAEHAHKHFHWNSPGYLNRLLSPQHFSACTAACLLLRKTVYLEAGGFDEQNLPIAFNDVDLCLRLRELGYSVIYTPYACLYHHESISRGRDQEVEQAKRARAEVRFFQKRWSKFLEEGDPFFHSRLSLASGSFTFDNIRPDYPGIRFPDTGLTVHNRS